MNNIIKKLEKDYRLSLSIIVILTFLAYSNTLVNQFVIEDQTFISNWELSHSLANIPKMIAGDTIPTGNWGAYRPVRAIVYALSYSLFGGNNPFFYHLQALLVHITVTVLIFLVTALIFQNINEVNRIKYHVLSIKGRKSIKYHVLGIKGKKQKNSKPIIHNTSPIIHNKYYLIPFVVALLFGLHPVHTEVVDYLTANFDAVSYIFFFASFYFYLKHIASTSKKLYPSRLTLYAYSIIFANLAFYSSEMTLTLPILILLFEFCFRPKLFKSANWEKLATMVGPLFVSAFVFLFVRFFVMNINVRGEYLAGSVYFTALTMLKVILKYLEWLVFPLNLSINPVLWGGISAWNHPLAHLERIPQQSFYELPVLISLGFLGLLGWLGVKFRKTHPVVSFSIGWFFISILPILYIIPQGTIFQERYIYIASFGYCLLVGYGLYQLLKYPLSKIFNLQFTIYKKKFKFKTSNSLLVTAYLLLVTSFIIFYGARTFIRNIDWKDSFNLWTALAKSSPDDILGNFYAGEQYKQKNMDSEALEYFQRALNIEYRLHEAHFAIGEIFHKQGNIDQAATKYYQTLSINPNFSEARQSLNLILQEGTSSANKNREDGWIECKLGDNFSFSCPEKYHKTASASGVLLKDPKSEFTISMSLETLEPGTNLEQYLSSQQETYGELLNQGQANFLNFDLAFVKIWNDTSTALSTSAGTQKIQFFLFKDDKVVKILVFPADSPNMTRFERLSSSITKSLPPEKAGFDISEEWKKQNSQNKK